MNTSLSVREARAQIVLSQVRDHPGLTSIEELAALPRIVGWDPAILADVIDLVVTDGRLRSDPQGHLFPASREDAA